jgi:type II secretory pathway component GspD/PulD (secretin)
MKPEVLSAALWLVGLAILAFPPAALPATSATPKADSAPADDDLVQLNFPENLEVKVLVDYVGKRLGMNILYDETVLKKRITISAPAKVPADSLLGLLESVLKVTGLALVDADQPGWKRVVEAKTLLAVTGQVREDTSALAGAGSTTAMTQVFALRHVTTAFIEQTIKPLLSASGGNSFSVPDRGLVVVTDYADALRRVADLIAIFDRPGRQATVRFVDVTHWDAGELARQVQSLLAEKRRAAGGDKAPAPAVALTHEPRTNRLVVVAAEGEGDEALDLVRMLDQPTGAQTRSYRFAHVSPARVDKLLRDFLGKEAQARYKATVDEEAGLLVVTAPPDVHARAEALRTDLDVAVSEDLSHVRFYKLMNTSAADVLATIRALEGTGGGLATLALDGAPGARPSTWQQLGPGPNAAPSLPGVELPKPPAYTPSKPAEESKEVAPPPSADAPGSGAAAQAVGASALRQAVVTVDSNTNTLIVVAPPPVQQVYKQLIDVLDKRRPQVMIEVTMVTLDVTDNFSLGIEISGGNDRDGRRWLTFSAFGLSTVDPVTGALALVPGLGFNGTLVDSNTVDVVLRALATSGRAKVLSAPRILVNDNATGTLTSVAESPFTSINASDTVATTSFAGYASAGTTVSVTAHISEDDYLRLIYSLTLNSFTGAGTDTVPPPRQTNSIDSEVVVPDGYSVIVGGLKRHDTSETVTKVPLLGDIPLLGYLFRNTTLTDIESALFVFIRPVILRDDRFMDLKHLSDWDLRRADLASGWPESEPMLMR